MAGGAMFGGQPRALTTEPFSHRDQKQRSAAAAF